MNIFRKKKSAFTLIELIVVLAISGAIAAGAVTMIVKSTKKSNIEGVNSDKALLKAKSESFINRVGDYPVLPDNITEYKNEGVYEFTSNIKKALVEINNVEYTDKGDDYLNQRFKVIDKNRLKQNGYIGDLVNNEDGFIYDLNSNEVYWVKDDLETLIKGLEESISLKDLRKTRVDYVLGSDKMNKAYDAISIGNVTYVGGEGTMLLIKVIEANGKVQLDDMTELLPQGTTRVNSVVKGEGNELVVGYLKENQQLFKVIKI
ncbi:type II secretion system protein [Clostridium tertium]|uniref:type II secretion system protein n=1 Tax=Clostridium tertium TaxID=1559 RepID=UPI0023B2FAB5|nr:prepilin-type N-terminal cleavage/methylation domain-containing protein [Clostridium tertium]